MIPAWAAGGTAVGTGRVIITKPARDNADQGLASSRISQRPEFPPPVTDIQRVPCIGRAQKKTRYRLSGKISSFMQIAGG